MYTCIYIFFFISTVTCGPSMCVHPGNTSWLEKFEQGTQAGSYKIVPRMSLSMGEETSPKSEFCCGLSLQVVVTALTEK